MDCENLLQEFLSHSVPVDRDKHLIADDVCDYINELAANACLLYEQRLEQRYEQQGRLYLTNQRPPEKLLLELFTSLTL